MLRTNQNSRPQGYPLSIMESEAVAGVVEPE